MKVTNLILLTLLLLGTGSVEGLIANPLKKECVWRHEDESVTNEMLNCIRSNVDIDTGKDFIDFLDSETWEKVLQYIKANPTGVPKLDFVTISRVYLARLCGGDKGNIGSSAFGINFGYKVVAQVLNPFYVIPKALSYAPKIGPFFKKIADFFEKPSKKMDRLSDELDEKCKRSGKAAIAIHKVLDVFSKLQLGVTLLDEAILPPIATKVCSDINAEVFDLIRKGGLCHKDNLAADLGQRQLSGQLPSECSLGPSLGQIRNKLDKFSAALVEIDNRITTARNIIEDILGPFETVVEALQVILDAFDPIVETFEPHLGFFEDLHDVFKYIRCPEEFLGPICSIQDLLAEGFNAILDAFGIPNLDDLVNELLSGLDIPDLDIEIDVFDLIDFENPLNDLGFQFENSLRTMIGDIDRDIFDPDLTPLSCRERGEDEWSVHVATSESDQVSFSCPRSGTRPIVIEASYSKWGCVQDMSGLFRYPCGNTGRSCSISFGSFSRCSSVGPEGSSEFKNLSPSYYFATYFCIPNDQDPEILSVLNFWDNSHFGPSETFGTKPIRGGALSYFREINHPEKITCNAGRIIDVDHKSWFPRKCLNVDYYNIDDDMTDYRKDLCTQDYGARRITPFRLEPYFSPYKNNGQGIDDWKYLWASEDAGSYDAITYTRVPGQPVQCDRPNEYGCGSTRISPSPDSDACMQPINGLIYKSSSVRLEYSNWDWYIRDCGTNDPSYPLREAEYRKRTAFVNEHYTDEFDRIGECSRRYDTCEGTTECDMNGCEVDFFHWACIDPYVGIHAAKVTYHYADTTIPYPKKVYCQLPRKVMILRAEFGSGFDITEASEAVSSTCKETSVQSYCDINATYTASQLSLNAGGKTVRTETLCACPAGHLIIPDPSDECIPCEWGKYRKEEMSTCELVPKGYFSNSDPTKRDVPFICPEGTFSEELGSQECQPCSAGYWSNVRGAKTSNTCQKCPVGTISPLPGRATECEVCGDGLEPNEQHTKCVPCAPGTAKEGLLSLCEPCLAGTFASGPGFTRCKPCDKGSFQLNQGETKCDLAPIGFYVPDNGRSVPPDACPEGKTTALKGSTTVDDCVTLGKYSCPDKLEWKTSSENSENCQNLVNILGVQLNQVGNGFCQPCLNVPECEWDGGDCCPETCTKNVFAIDEETGEEFVQSYSCDSRYYQCLAPRNKGLDCTYKHVDDESATETNDPCPLDLSIQKNADLIGNGVCNALLNSKSCGYDGGDCCLFTCVQVPGVDSSCVPDEMDCKDPQGLIDKEDPILHNLPERNVEVSCSMWDIPAIAEVYATDNDPCSDSIVSFKEWTDKEPPLCGSRKIYRQWSTTDPQGNTAEFTQTIHLLPDIQAPEWTYFPADRTLLFATSKELGSLSPEYTGWPTFLEACQEHVSLSYNDKVSIENVACSGEKRIERYWTAVDSCGNANTKKQTLHIKTTSDKGRALFGTAGDYSLFQIAATQGDVSVFGKSDDDVVEGTIAAPGDISLTNTGHIADGICSLLPTAVVGGKNVRLDREVLPVSNSSDSADATVLYFKKLKSTSRNTRGGKKDTSWARRMHSRERATIFEDSCLLASTMDDSNRFANDEGLYMLQDGDVDRECDVEQLGGYADPDRQTSVSCFAKTTVVNTTTGLVQREKNKLKLFAPHPIFNAFTISLKDFVGSETKEIIISCKSTAAVIINVRGNAERPGRGNSDFKIRLNANYFHADGCSSGQVLVNFPDLTGHIRFDSKSDSKTLPFSILAPKTERIRIDDIEVSGQIISKAIETHRSAIRCPLYQGSFSCADLHRETTQANATANSTGYNSGDVTCTIKPEHDELRIIAAAPELFCHCPNPYNINNANDHNYAGMITAPKDVDIWGKGFIDGPVQVTEIEFFNNDSLDLKRKELKFRMSIQTVNEHVLAEDDRLQGLLKHNDYASEEYPSTNFTLEGTLTRYTSQAYQSKPFRRNPFPHCDRVATKGDTKDWFFWRRVKDVTITDQVGEKIPFEKVEASLKRPFQIGCGANNVNRKLGVGATFELQLDGHRLEFELFADLPATNCAEDVDDYNDLCYDNNLKFYIDFPN